MRARRATQLSGMEKTAILLNVLGKDKSFEFMKEMKDPEVRNLLQVMAHMKKAPIQVINSVLREYLFKLSEKEEIIFDDNFSQPDVISKGLGEERASKLFGALKGAGMAQRKHLTVLDNVDAKALSEFLSDEHPQTIALVVAHMDIQKQMQTLKHLPDSIRPEVILRMSNLDYIAPEKVEELDEVLKKELLGGGGGKGSLGGIDAVAELVNSLDKKTMNSLMARIEDKDPILAEEIRQHMFTFVDILKIDDKGIQLILREVPQDKLLLSLKSAPEELREKIFRSMSERAAAMLREDLGALGPQKVSDVEIAQRAIITIVQRLEEEGKIIIGVGDENEIIP